MFVKAATLVLALAAFVNAVPNANIVARTDSSECDTGSIQCCTQNYGSVGGLLGLGSLFGGCSPLNVIGLGTGNTCQQEPVCCENVTNDGLIGINCSPINVNL